MLKIKKDCIIGIAFANYTCSICIYATAIYVASDINMGFTHHRNILRYYKIREPKAKSIYDYSSAIHEISLCKQKNLL